MTQYINKLPAVFQTVTEKKFFDATMDQVFSKKDSDYLAGFLGRRAPGRYNPISDFYIPEPSKNRTWWQLEATAFSRNPDTTRSNIYFYEDLLNRIEYYDGNTLNQDRLFESEYYSFGPPIDYDMFINYQNYYWIEQGLPVITITGVVAADIIGQSSYTTPVTADPPNLTLTTGMNIALPDDPDYADPHYVENFGGCIGIKLVDHFPDFTAGTIFEFLPWDGQIELSNGRIIDNRFWDATTWDTQTQPSTGDYITIERGALDRNAWSRTNKWFHIYAINATINATGTGFPVNATRALRPIIQFIADIPLYKSGTQFREEINYGFRDDVFGNPLRRATYQGRQLALINDEFDIQMRDGDIVGFFNDDTEFNFWDIEPLYWDVGPPPEWDAGFGRINQFLYKVVVALDGTVDFAPYTSWATPVLEGDIVFVLEDGPWDAAQRGQTWYYSLGIWQKAFNDKIYLNQAPLFVLYDHNGIELDDPVTYPGSDFRGSKIFSYKINTEPGATVDPVLRFPIVYTSLRQASDIMFQNDLITERYVYGTAKLDIDGYYYYKTTTSPILYNNWNLYQPCPCDDIVPPPPCNCLETSKQRVIDKFVVGYGSKYQFKLSVIPYGYPVAPDIIVSVNGVEVKSAADQIGGYTFVEINNRIYVDLTVYLTNLLLVTQSQPPVVETQTYTWENLDPVEPGYFQIPQQLEANPTQEEVTELSGSDLTQHFASIIANQIGFTGTSFGGDNNYRDTRKNRSLGTFILQNVSPLLKTMLVSSSDDLDFIKGLTFSQDEYTKFKNKYLQTALQLINNGFNPVQYYNNSIVISMWVEEILKIVNVSKEFSNAFAYSYMIANGSPFANETFTVPMGGLLTLSNYVDLNDPKNALYVYDTTGSETLLTVGVDYEVVSTNLSIEVQLNTVNVSVGNTVYVALYKNPLPAYIPSTPSKIGAYGVYLPRIELDTSYVIPTNVIIGHDGSKTIAYGDYRDQLLLELEKRIYNLIQYKFRHQHYLPIRLEDVKPGYFRQTRYTKDEYLDITESYLNKWSAKNRANYRANDWTSASLTAPMNQLWKLYNYSVAEDATTGAPLNLPGNWKGIFQYYYDTYYPDTRPWEMFGFSEQPSWWTTEYGLPVLNLAGQEVWTSTAAGAHNMYADLEAGIIRQGPSAIYDPVTLAVQPNPMWARPGLSSIIPVDAAGEIISVMTLFNVVFSGNPFEPFDGYDNDWKYGDGSPVEQAWMSTSSYAFTIQEILMLTRPAPYGELMWDTLGTELSPGMINVPASIEPVMSTMNWQFVQNDIYTNADSFFAWMRPKNKDQIVHAESVDNEIQVRFGYQRWVSDRILFLGKNVTETFGQKIRTLDVNLANKLAGFTNKDTTNTYIESISPGATTNTLIIPSNNFEVVLHKSPPVDTYSYSGVIIRGLADGTFVVYGYDLINSEFITLDRSNAKLIEITVGGTPAEFLYFTIGATYKPGDIVRYNGVYYLNLETQIADSFVPTRWKKLNGLPVVGGIEVSYKPVSLTTITKVPYGTIYKTAQEVFDFLIGWGAWLETQGWKFDDVNQDTNQLNDWLNAGKQYLFWLNTAWAPDASIQLSPLANRAVLEVKSGYPENVETLSNGVYSILDKFGVAIAPNNTSTDRDGRLISVEPTNLASGGIYYLQINTTETEHILIFDNETSFSDVIYSPLLRARQDRLRFNGFRSNGWYGKMEAPGYLIIDNELVPNYDTIVEAMRYYYDSNVTIDNPSLEDLGRHLIGYESKSYLDNLQVSNDVQYLFYQGVIREKGTEKAFTKLFRSTKVQSNEIIKVFEEWALKLGEFGNTIDQVSTEFILKPEQNTGEVIIARLSFVPSKIGFVRQINILNAQNIYTEIPKVVIYPPDADPADPELIEPLRIAKAYVVLDSNGRISRVDITDPGYGYLEAPYVEIDSGSEPHNLDKLYSVWQGSSSMDETLDNVINIDIDQVDKWIVRPNDPQYSLTFPTTNKIDYATPNAGYVNFNDVDWYSFDTVSTAVQWGTDKLNPTENETLWVAKTFTEDWDVYKLIDVTAASGFDVFRADGGDLYLKTDLSYLITPETSATGNQTDFGNLLAFQVIEAQAKVYKPELYAAIQAIVPISATAITSITGDEVTSITIVQSGTGLDDNPIITIDPPPAGITATAMAVVVDGILTEIIITNTGSGYISAPNITIESPVGLGTVREIDILSSGYGYDFIPDVIITGDGTGAQATAIITDGILSNVIITNPGTGYTTAVAALTTTDGTIHEIVVTKSGMNYISSPNVQVLDNGITFLGCTAKAIVYGGKVTSIEILTPGAGYTNPIVIIAPPTEILPEASYALAFLYDFSDTNYNFYKLVNLDGVPLTEDDVPVYADFTKLMLYKSMRFVSVATGEPVLNAGTLSSINIISGGEGYQIAPDILINGDGIGASANAILTNGIVTSVIVNNAGSGYTFMNVSFMPPDNPSYVVPGDKIWIDNVDKKWSVLEYNTTNVLKPQLNPFRIQEPLINSSLFQSARVFATRTKHELVLLPILDPFKDILPGPAKQNISYISMQDPARYNVTGNERLYSSNITFGEAQVGQLWWDTSSARYVYYEQPIALDGSETEVDNLVYRRDRWGQLFPGSTVAIYEWVKSPVPPAEYTGTGIPRNTDNYVQVVTSNRFTSATEINYYFWVLGATDKPNIENRTIPALDVTMLLESPKSQNFIFFCPIQQTPTNNSYMFYNVLEILSYRGDNVQIQYRLTERDDQEHVQWALFREGDPNSIVTDQFWNKMVDSLCGYTKVLPVSAEYENGIIVAKDLPWDIYGWDIALWDTATATTSVLYGEILPVPDPMLTEDEKYGIQYRPRQGMFIKLQAARKIFVQAGNSLLKHIPIRDNDPGWNSGVNSDIYWEYTNWYAIGFENAVPTVVFQTLIQANAALVAGQLVVGDIVQVTNGTFDNRFILYSVVQSNPNIPVLSLEEVGIENSAIKLLDTIYTVTNHYGLSVELRELLDAFRTKVMVDIYKVDQNELFFSLVNYVLSEQKNPDWVFKSSYIYIKENNLPLSQERLYIPDQIDNIIKYITDVKPYHTQIRDYTSTYVTTDIAPGTSIDSYKINTILTFGPANTDYVDAGHWDAVCNEAVENITEAPWEIYAWDVCPPPVYVLNAQTFTDNIEQFVSEENVYTVPLTFFDASKIGYSQLFPYTFDFNSLNLNNPQTFITPYNIVGVQIGTEVLIYGRDYFVEYNGDTTYTAYFYNDPGNSPVPAALVWFNGGGMQPFKYNTSRNEVAYGFPKDDLVVNIDTKLPVNEVDGILRPYVGWGDVWEEIGDPVAQALIDAGGHPEIPWDMPLNTVPVLLDNIISSKENTNPRNGTNFFRNALLFGGILLNDITSPTSLDENIEVITVFVDPVTHPINTDILSNPFGNSPGIIWIQGERIEYRMKTLIAPNTWELRLVRRGTMGTAPTKHLAMIPSLANPLILVPNPVWVEKNNYLPVDANIEVWNVLTAPALPDPSTEGPINEFTSVTNVPVGGLWYSYTTQAEFLKQEQGNGIP